MSKLTIREIARLAEVSVSTVSRVINDMPDVNAKTRERVNSLIDEHGYVPNASARTLKQNQTNIICIVVKGIHNPFFAPIVENIQQEIAKTKYLPVVHYIDESSDEVSVASHLLIEKKAVGLIFLGGNPTSKARAVSKFKVPCVLSTMTQRSQELKNVSSVCVDDFKAAGSAVRYLTDRGHRSIAILGGRRMDRDLVWNRYNGAVKAMEEKGFSFDEENYIESKFSLEYSYRATREALASDAHRFTAIFAMSDIMAIGAMKAIHDAGLNVPGDISVIGFDGIRIGQYFDPSLTTVRQPYEEIAVRSTKLLVDNIEGRDTGRNIVLDTLIMEGDSVRSV